MSSPIVFPPPITSVTSGGVILDNTLAGETSNSYCSLDYANTYWAAHYNQTQSDQWANLAESQQIILLAQACRSIERIRFVLSQTLPNYSMSYDRRTRNVVNLNLTRDPVRYYYYQKLQFPRNLDIYYVQPPTGIATGTLFMRQEPQDAQCEQAMYLLNLDTTAVANRLQGITMDTLGLGRDQVSQTQEYGSTGTLLAPLAIEILSGLMVKGGRMQRG